MNILIGVAVAVLVVCGLAVWGARILYESLSDDPEEPETGDDLPPRWNPQWNEEWGDDK